MIQANVTTVADVPRRVRQMHGRASGYLVSFGGLFGNQICKGESFLPVITSEEQLFRVTDAPIQFFDDYANPSERFRFTLERVGIDKFKEVIKEAYNG